MTKGPEVIEISNDRDEAALQLLYAVPERGTRLCGGCASDQASTIGMGAAFTALAEHPFVVEAVMAGEPLDRDHVMQVGHDAGVSPGRVNPLVTCLTNRAQGVCGE